VGRKSLDIEITAEKTSRGKDSRDLGRKYRITEMPASKAEKWATRAWLAISHAGKEVPPGVAEAGMVGFALYTFAALADAKYDDLEPLMDEMMGCVEFITGVGTTRPLVEEDIEEVDTRAVLRLEVLHLHVGFTIHDWLSRIAKKRQDALMEETTSTTQTSQD
jgi:hypothetical protein